MARANPDPDVETAAAEAPASTVTFAVAHPYDQWNHGIDGVDPITSAGVEVPADKEDAIRDAAKTANVTIRKVR